MPRKYNPVIRREIYGCHLGEEYARMEESQHGEWVKLETYKHSIAQLKSQLDSLKAELKKYKNPTPVIKPDTEFEKLGYLI